MGILQGDALTVLIGIFGIHTEGYVTSFIVELTIQLEHTSNIVVLGIVQAY